MTIKAAVHAEIIANERIRIQQIVESAEGKAHPATALHFALYSDLSAAMAISTMAPLPKESPFLSAMDREGAVDIRPGHAAASTLAVGDDPRAARMAELAATAQAHGVAKGFRAKAAK